RIRLTPAESFFNERERGVQPDNSHLGLRNCFLQTLKLGAVLKNLCQEQPVGASGREVGPERGEIAEDHRLARFRFRRCWPAPRDLRQLKCRVPYLSLDEQLVGLVEHCTLTDTHGTRNE